MITIILISTLAWLLYTVISAIVEAHYYALFPSEKKHKNIHWLYVILRGIAISFILWNLWYDLGTALTLIFGFCLCCVYSFFHNGTYYLTRHKLDEHVYPKGFWDASTTSQATIELGVGMRTALAVIGFIGITLIIIT